jgi:hypothetical protein
MEHGTELKSRHSCGGLVRSLIAVERAPVPFSPDHTLMMRTPLSDEPYPTPASGISFFRELLDRVRALFGVKAATIDVSYPFLDMWGTHVQERVSRLTREPRWSSESGLSLMERPRIERPREHSLAGLHLYPKMP